MNDYSKLMETIGYRFKNLNLLRKYVTEKGKILPSRVTQVSTKKQIDPPPETQQLGPVTIFDDVVPLTRESSTSMIFLFFITD